MKVRVRVNYPVVGMAVGVDQVRAQQQLVIRQDLRWCAAGGNCSRFQHQDAVSDVLHNLQLMGRGNHRLRRTLPVVDEIDELALAARIEGCCGLVQEQHLGFDDDD